MAGAVSRRNVVDLSRERDPRSASDDELLTLRRAVEASGEVIFMTDVSGVISYVNPEFVRVYGYTPSEVVGRTTPRILKSGRTTPVDYGTFWEDLRQQRIVRREFVNRTKSGALVHVESSANPILADGQLVGFLAVQRDVTARKDMEAALRDSEVRYRTLAEAAHDSIFIVNRDRVILYANAVSAERFGVRVEDAVGKTLADVFPEPIAEQMWDELLKVFASGKREYSEARYELPVGELWLESWLVPLESGSSGPGAVMGVARDITDRKRLERQYLQAQKMEAVGQLASGIAHDFNNLLTAIIGYSELLLDRVKGDRSLAADVQEVKKAGERAGRLTRQLLAFSRKQVVAPQVLDLNEVVTDLHKMLGRVIGEDIQLEVVAGSRLSPVYADAGQIEQIVMNLAVNARDAMATGGALRIVTENAVLGSEFVRQHDGAAAGRYVMLTVQDSGCGMSGDVLSHVFEPFFTTKPVGKGTGLGLATVYGIVKQSSGYVHIDSAVGVGTTVSVYLPAVDAAVQRRDSAPTTACLSGTETILLVEDEAGLRRLMKRALERCGYTVLESDDANHALAIADKSEPPIDLLLTDVVMPGIGGPELAQQIRQIRPEIKLLFVSGFTSHDGLAGRLLSQPEALLGKPFTPHALAARVRACLDTEGSESDDPTEHRLSSSGRRVQSGEIS
jgi:PAS domain S-box-containing protein